MKPNTKVNSDPPRAGEGEILDGPAKDTENATTTACSAHETSRGIGCELLCDWAARYHAELLCRWSGRRRLSLAGSA
jgi:hypothetical protein